jgi:hypothetical protein
MLKKYWKNIRSFLIKKKAPIWNGKKDYTVQFAFEFDGVKYYEIPGVLNIPYQRGLAAADIYEEVEMRLTREYLLGHVKAVGEMLSDPKKLNLVKLVEFYKDLEERMEWIVSPETLYKLASVVYFDENENPEEYNYKYNIDKIAKWKTHSLDSFFLQKPILKLMPHLGLSEKDLVQHLSTTMKIEAMQAESVLQTLSKINWTKDFYKILLSQARSLKEKSSPI